MNITIDCIAVHANIILIYAISYVIYLPFTDTPSTNKFKRYGICKKCGRTFLTDKAKEGQNIIDFIKSFWKPDLCPKCQRGYALKQ